MSDILYVLRTKYLEMMVCQGCAEIAVDLGILTANTPIPQEASNP